MPSGFQNNFFLSAVRNEDGDFEFKDGLEPIATNFTLLKVQADTESNYCLTAKFDSTVGSLKLFESDCSQNNGTICRMWKNENQDCSVPFVKRVNSTKKIVLFVLLIF